ncbi:hypothetical protein [Skermanella pratensis]|uniref:hypothetical protein n=1 Tax=Skermanella pratensis TaxID=2233999 RepID=UPI00130129CC|nr:hypothetical protein [Skermanella pratensis]
MQVIRVADHARELEDPGLDRFSAAYEERLERVLKDLFSACPDCASDAWEEAADDFDSQVGREKVVEFCLERGYDVRRNPGGNTDGKTGLVGCWRDVGIMLLARDRGLIDA